MLERTIEVRQSRLLIPPRELDIAEADLSGIERRGRLERRRKLALRALQIAGLEKRPAAAFIFGGRRVGELRGNDRRNEVGKSRERDGRQRHALRHAGRYHDKCHEDGFAH